MAGNEASPSEPSRVRERGVGVPFRLINAPERGEFHCKLKAHRGAGAGPGLHFVRGGVRVALCGR